MPEQRMSPRRRVLKGAKIAFEGGSAVIDCLVRNLSETGAALQVESPVGIPAEFELILGNNQAHHCRVVWRKKASIGVKFVRR